MTTDTPAATICPNCGETEGTTLSTGLRLCFACRNEWDVALAAEQAADVDAVTKYVVDSVLGPPAEVVDQLDAQARLDALIGTEVILEGGQRARIEGFPDDDRVTVRYVYDDGESVAYDVEFNDVIRAVEPAPAVIDLPSEEARALAATAGTIAALTLRAGIGMISGEHPNRVIGLPPTGWLPDDPGTIAIVEQGVAYAVAILLHAYNIDAEQAAAFADDLMTEVQNDNPKGDR